MRRIAQALCGAVALLLTATGVAHADVTHVNTFSVTATGEGVSLPISVGAPGQVLAVGVSTVASVDVAAVTYAGQPLTSRIERAAHGTRAEIWTLTAPTAGEGTVQVTLSGSATATVGASLFTGVDLGSPVLGANAGDADTGATSAVASLNGTTAADGMLGVLALGNVGNTYNVRAGGSTDLVTSDVRWNEVGAVRAAGATRSGNTGQNMAPNAGVNWRWNRIDPAQKNPYTLAVVALRAGVTNTAPGADAGGPYAIAEGQGVTLDARASVDADGDRLTYAWDLGGDGDFDDATGAAPRLTWAELQALGLGDGPAATSVRVRVSDAETSTTSAAATLTVTNVAPSASFSHSGDVVEGEEATVSFTDATDPSATDTAAGLRYAYDFDGVAAVGGPSYAAAVTSATAAVPAALLADGPRTVRVTAAIFDKDGGLRTYSATVTVENVAPTATFTGATVVEGTPATVRFSEPHDPSAADAEAGLRYEYDLDGDGEFEPGEATATVPAANGPARREIRGAIVDRDGGRTVYTATVEVTNAAPAASISGPETVPSSGAVELTLTAGDAADELRGTLDWGDGTQETVSGGGERTVGHTYAAPGDYTVTYVVDDGLERATAKHALSVATLPAPRTNPQPEATPEPTATPAPPAAGGVAGVTATQPLRISGLEVTPRCIRAPGLRAAIAGARTVSVRFRLSADASVRFSLARWKDKPGAASCPPARGVPKAGGKRIAGVYAVHTKRALAARAGVNTVKLAATDATGKKLRPGTYLLTVTSGTTTSRTKVWVLAN